MDFDSNLSIRPNLEGRKNTNLDGRKIDETAEKIQTRTAEFDERAEYDNATLPTYYITAF